MFELRVQNSPTTPGESTAGRALRQFGTYEQALAGLDAEQRRLAEQLVANGCGSRGGTAHATAATGTTPPA